VALRLPDGRDAAATEDRNERQPLPDPEVIAPMSDRSNAA
jgi:hypothetical protein